MRFLIQLLLVLSFTGTSVPGDLYAEDNQLRDAELYSGKTLDEWIGQAKQGRTLEDREDALQTLRNLGLRRDRDKTLRAFTELLSDKAPTIRSLAAAGLRKAGKPTDPKAAAKLVEATQVASILENGGAAIWELATQRVLITLPPPPFATTMENPGLYFNCIRLSPDGRLVAGATALGEMAVWQLPGR